MDNNNENNKRSVSAFENHRYVITGLSNVGQTYYNVKTLEKIGNRRPIRKMTRSPNQYLN